MAFLKKTVMLTNKNKGLADGICLLTIEKNNSGVFAILKSYDFSYKNNIKIGISSNSKQVIKQNITFENSNQFTFKLDNHFDINSNISGVIVKSDDNNVLPLLWGNNNNCASYVKDIIDVFKSDNKNISSTINASNHNDNMTSLSNEQSTNHTYNYINQNQNDKHTRMTKQIDSIDRNIQYDSEYNQCNNYDGNISDDKNDSENKISDNTYYNSKNTSQTIGQFDSNQCDKVNSNIDNEYQQYGQCYQEYEQSENTNISTDIIYNDTTSQVSEYWDKLNTNNYHIKPNEQNEYNYNDDYDLTEQNDDSKSNGNKSYISHSDNSIECNQQDGEQYSKTDCKYTSLLNRQKECDIECNSDQTHIQSQSENGGNYESLFEYDDNQVESDIDSSIDGQNQFYNLIKEQLDELFSTYPEHTLLNQIIPDSKWAKVDYDKQGKDYIVGVIDTTDKKYICYGVPSVSENDPPEHLKEYSQWLPLKDEQIGCQGYWLMYQDGDTGENISIKDNFMR